jgi:molybdate transport system substrate-binding protein
MGLLKASRLRRLAALAGAGLLTAACSATSRTEPAAQGPLRVAAALSLTDVLNDAGTRWTATGHPPIEFNFAASNVLARQILEGAPVDVFISADEAQMDRVVSEDAAGTTDRVTLFTNQLVIVVPAGRALPGTPPESLADNAVKRVAIGDPQGVPAGVYAKTWLEHIGLWRRIEPKVVPSASVRAALVAVEAANADAGIVYRTDARNDVKVNVAYEVPIADAPAIVYPGAVMKRAPHPETARLFITFLQSAASREAFAASGFLAPDSAAAR